MKPKSGRKGPKKGKKKYGVIWYMVKHDYLVELEPSTGYGLIIMLIKWDSMFDRNDWMFLGAV